MALRSIPRARVALLGGAAALALLALTALFAVFMLPRASDAAPRAETKAAPRPSARPRPAPAASSRPPKEERLVIVAGGDVNFGREAGQAILSDPTYDPFKAVEPLWRDADITFANLESQLSEQKGETQSTSNRLIFTGPPGGADVLRRAGFDVVSTANNHAWDYGRSALFETLDNLARAGVQSVGTGKTFEAAYAPAILKVRGFSVAIFAVTHIWNQGVFAEHEGRNYVAWARLNLLRKALEQAHSEHDVVLFSYHGGVEYIDAPVGPTRRFLEAVMATGYVDAVIGHHPHVPQGIGWYKKRPIFYSLGNFVFAGHDWSPRTKVSFLARLEIKKSRAIVARACPYALDGHVPRPIAPTDPRSAELRAYFRSISATVGGTRFADPDAQGCWELSPGQLGARQALDQR